MAYPQRTLRHIRHGEGESVADIDRLSQLLGNLVSNAMAYGDADFPVSVTSSIEAGTFAIEVHNHGAPIPTELLPTLFEPMTRGVEVGDSSRSVGLGLFIVREIVRAHAGQVTVTSSLDAGTSFRTTFPRA
jgi:sigma-B regulation protein RsbU (phosphoserine phosphatase)